MRTKKICSHLKIHSKEFFVHKFTHGILKKKKNKQIVDKFECAWWWRKEKNAHLTLTNTIDLLLEYRTKSILLLSLVIVVSRYIYW